MVALVRRGLHIPVLAYTVDGQALAVEYDPIVRVHRTNLGEDLEHSVNLGISVSQQIQVTRGPKRHVEPGRHQHRTLQDEAIAKAAGSETVENAFDRIARQNEIESLSTLLGDDKKPGVHRSAHVDDGLSHWQ